MERREMQQTCKWQCSGEFYNGKFLMPCNMVLWEHFLIPFKSLFLFRNQQLITKVLIWMHDGSTNFAHLSLLGCCICIKWGQTPNNTVNLQKCMWSRFTKLSWNNIIMNHIYNYTATIPCHQFPLEALFGSLPFGSSFP